MRSIIPDLSAMINPIVLNQTQGKEVDEVEVVLGSCGRDVKVWFGTKDHGRLQK